MSHARLHTKVAPGQSLTARCGFFFPAVPAPQTEISGACGINLAATALNSIGWLGGAPLDIELAKREGFVIADASGVVGFVPLAPGQRDPHAERAKDPNQDIGE